MDAHRTTAPPSELRRKRLLHFALVGGLIVAWLALCTAAHELYRERHAAGHRAKATRLQTDRTTALAHALSERIGLLNGLSVHVTTLTGQLPDGAPNIGEDLARYGQALPLEQLGIINLTYADGTLIHHAYPPTRSNLRLVGLDHAKDPRPAFREAARRAIETREMTLQGPDDLVHGVRGFIARIALFDGDTMWGMVSATLDEETLIAAASLRSLPPDVDLAIRDGSGRSVLGPASLFASAGSASTMPVPGGTWEILVAPKPEAMALPLVHSLLFLAVSLLVAGLGAYLAWRRNQERDLLTRAVADRSLALDSRDHLLAAQLEAQARIEQLSFRDPLTGLGNHAALHARLHEAVARARSQDRPLTLAMIDLDRFENINSSLGRSIGDAVIREVASRIEIACDGTHHAARIAGDEFFVILEGVSAADGETWAEALRACLAVPLSVTGNTIHVTCSIGLASHPDGGDHPDDLLRATGIALHAAKSKGSNQTAIFSTESADQARYRRHVELDLRQALERGELYLAFQPQVRTGDGTTYGFEALLRWRRPGGDAISPALFIPIAEESGLIVPIGAWVLERAFGMQARLAARGHDKVRLSVNLSSVQFRHSDLAGLAREALASTGAVPSMIDLEITESLLLDDSAAVHGQIESLRGQGFQLSLDDFGAGHASFAYVQRFAPDQIKIDRAFIAGLHRNKANLGISKAIVQMAHSIGACTVAEGVESREELDCLQAMGCDLVQGFLFAKPMSEAEAFAWLARDHRQTGDLVLSR